MKRFAYGALVAGVLAVPAVSFAQHAEGPNGSAARLPSTVASGPSTAHAFAVFVDRPTGFTFVNLPSGWKFVGTVTQDDTEHLPPGVLTSVTAGER